MVTLGDTLAGRGQLYAAQFCYIVSAVEFGTFSKKSSKVDILIKKNIKKQERSYERANECPNTTHILNRISIRINQPVT